MNKLIERDFPFDSLSLVAERESWRKEVYRPVYYLHKWWAKRLGSVFRGVLLAACLDESEDFWKNYYQKNDFRGTIVFDPFMGSGVTIGEAIKLGCRAMGRDINPVAYLSCRASMSKYDIREVLSAYQEMEAKVAAKLLSYFETRTDGDKQAIVLYYFLVKVVPCPCCGKNVDLFRSRIFSRNAVARKDPSARALCPECGAVNYTRYDVTLVTCSDCSYSYNPQIGNVTGADVECDSCKERFRLVDRMKDLDGPLKYRRYAKMILANSGAKSYSSINTFDKQLEDQIQKEFKEIVGSFPVVPVQPGYNTNQMLKHNYRHWVDLFSDRQLVCIHHLVHAIRQIGKPELRLLFACLFSGTLEFNNLFTSFKGEGTGAVRHMFSHHVLKPELMPLEANLWGTSKSSGSFSTLFRSRIEAALAYKADPTELRINNGKSIKVHRINKPVAVSIADSFSSFQQNHNSAYLAKGDSSCTDIPDKSVSLVVTDPPFFDNVHYSELADFFYYWLRQLVDGNDSQTTRSPSEVQDTRPALFTKKLTSVFSECNRVLSDDGLFIFTYHHSRHEGWTAVHRAIRHGGFYCVQAYPIKSEMSVSMPLQQAKTPIHLDLVLVCKKEAQAHSAERCEDALTCALEKTKEQVSALSSVGIKVSLGDAKVVLMGQLLRQAHLIRNLDMEEHFLSHVEKEVDIYVGQVMESKGEILYTQQEPEQLVLFEKMGEYLANKRIDTYSE